MINCFDEIKREEIIKVSLVDPKGASGYSFPILEKILKGKVEIAVSGFDCVDIVNKTRGIKRKMPLKYCKKNGILHQKKQ